MPLCPHCGDEQEIDLHEVWNSREFLVSTCCEQSEEEVRWGLAHDPEWARGLLQHLGIEAICGERLRRVADDGLGALILDWQLRLDRIAFRDVRRFIDRHHEHLAGPTGWRYGQGIWNGPDLIGVVTVGQPLARAFDPHQVVEVTRLCVRRDRADALRWNACSQLYGWAAREAQQRGFRCIISYTRQDEDGGTLRAVGWHCDGPAGGRSWNWRGRPRVDRAPPFPRLRWSREFTPARAAPGRRRLAAAEPCWLGEPQGYDPAGSSAG